MRPSVGSLMAAVVLLATAATAEAAAWYVSPAGSDAAAGTLDQPFATVTRGARAAGPGDTVYARGGTYAEVVKITARGTSAARIVIRSYPGEKAVIDGTGTAADTNLVQLTGTEFVDFVGFEVRGATRIGICAWGAKQTSIRDNAVHGSRKSGIWAGYSTFGVSSDLTIAGNNVYGNVLENQYHAAASGWSQAVGVQRSDRVEILDNSIYRNDGEGVGVVLSDHVNVRANEIFDNFSVGVYLDNAQFAEVDRNFVYGTGDSRWFRNGQPAHGIAAANETYADTNPLTDVRVTNNIVLRSRSGFAYGNYEAGGGLRNTVVANNTFYESTAALLSIDAAAHLNSRIENNLFVQTTGTALASVAGGGILYRNNGWAGGSAGAAAGLGDIYGDPRLVSGGGPAATDYRLAGGSPLIDKGTDVTGLTTDFFGTTRRSPLDIGAHEVGAFVTSEPAPVQPARRSTKRRSARH